MLSELGIDRSALRRMIRAGVRSAVPLLLALGATALTRQWLHWLGDTSGGRGLEGLLLVLGVALALDMGGLVLAVGLLAGDHSVADSEPAEVPTCES